MTDPEIKALAAMTEALAELSEEQRRNVLLYINSRYGVSVKPPRAPGAEADSQAPATHGYANLGDFFDAVNPQTEADRVLAVAYWVQAVEGMEDFESFPVNKQLKNLGHPVSNITRAIDSMIAQTPRLIIQTAKTGTAKQARKRYKVTREGLKRVQQMLAASEEGVGGE
jgi:hypothetical protein